MRLALITMTCHRIRYIALLRLSARSRSDVVQGAKRRDPAEFKNMFSPNFVFMTSVASLGHGPICFKERRGRPISVFVEINVFLQV